MNPTFSYNGIKLDEPVQTIHYKRSPEMDGTTYLWTVINLRVKGLYNPATTSYHKVGQQVVAEKGHPPAETESAIRHKLMQPRGTLTYNNGSNVNLIVPAPGATRDAENGPIPKIHDVVKVHGEKSWQIEIEVECRVTECDLFTSTPPFMASHRWEMIHSYNSQFLLERTIVGRAIFNMALLPANLQPDDFRQFLFPSCPPGFKRSIPNITAEESGTQLEYTVVDTEQRMSIKALGVTDFDCFVTAGYNEPSAGEIGMASAQASLGIVDTIGQTIASVFAGQAALGGGGALPAAGSPARDLAVAAQRNNAFQFRREHSGASGAIFSHLTGFVQNAVPTRHLTVVVRVWGNKRASLAYLSSVAYTILATRTSRVQSTIRYSRGLEEFRDHKGGFVELRATYQVGIADQVLQLVGLGPAANVGDVTGLMVDDESLGAVVPEPLAPVAGSSIPPNGSGTRGYYLGLAVAQALQGDCQAPPKPTNPRNVTASPPNPNA